MAPLLEARDLKRSYALRRGLVETMFRREHLWLRAVDGVSLTVGTHETLGIVGESGCGKSTLGRLLIRLEQPDEGQILYRGVDLAPLTEGALRPYRKSLQIVFQDPYATLNPRQRVGSILAEAVRFHRMRPPDQIANRVAELLEQVELTPELADRYPSHLSGGQRQRVGIARALAVEPNLIVADEPVSALDVSVQAQILNLINDLKQELGVSWIFIGHNLASVRQVADRIAVMYLGRIVEQGLASVVLRAPLHPYTQALLEAVPQPDPTRRLQTAPLRGDPPSPIDLPRGCRFAPRCPLARPLCRVDSPSLVPTSPAHDVACWAVIDRSAWESTPATPGEPAADE